MPEHLLHGYSRFRTKYFAGERDYLLRLATEGQRPSALYVGCCDSRVIPELLTHSAPGELFVVRNIANQVPELEHADASVGAAVEYAVAHLQVRHAIVCGHYGCGGVKAALAGREALRSLPSLYEWLEGIEPAIARVPAAQRDSDDGFRMAVEENVPLQMDRLITFEPVRKALGEERLQLHGWIYDLTTARLLVYDVESDRFVYAQELAG